MRDFHLPGRSPVLAVNGMCATSHPLAAAVANDLLKRGGNAMDAAIGAAVLLGICEPPMTGIGGDCFVLYVRAGERRVRALNGSGRAPNKASPERLRRNGHNTVPLRGVDAVTIPGAVDAFCHLSEREGKLGLDSVLAPAIRYAEEGVPVAPRVAFDWERNIYALRGAGRRFFLINERAPRVGQRFAAPGQAEVLRRIARDGRKAFYEGEVVEDMLRALRKEGGLHCAEDFTATCCSESEPMAGKYRGMDVIEHPPNGQGATALLLLNILDHFDIACMSPQGAERVHIEAEAAKLAYDARNRIIADPDHTSRLGHMLSRDTATRLAKRINPSCAMPTTAPLAEAVHRDTVYLTVVDRDRMAVSMIYSLFHGLGSGIVSERFGILLQNRGAGFTLEEGHPNELGGGKRPMHTIIPGMVCDGRELMPFGVMGGAYQPNGHARVLSNLRDFGMELQEAIDAPRSFAHEGELQLERGYPDQVRNALAELGHRISVPDTPIGGAQAIRIRRDGILEGASDPRKDGCALGY